MSHATETLELLRLLHRHGVDFIVVGMTAGVLQGVPALTFDLDVVYSRDPENLLRLLAALQEIDARFRGDDRRLPPNISHLESSGHKLLETTLGDLDALGMIDDGVGYEGLIADTILLDTGGFPVRVLSLRRLIEVKERAGRPRISPCSPYSGRLWNGCRRSREGDGVGVGPADFPFSRNFLRRPLSHTSSKADFARRLTSGLRSERA